MGRNDSGETCGHKKFRGLGKDTGGKLPLPCLLGQPIRAGGEGAGPGIGAALVPSAYPPERQRHRPHDENPGPI
jgi:hypothetical protein